MLAHIHPFLQRFACKDRPIFKGLAAPGSASGTIPGPPRAQSPFARLRRYLLRRDVFCIPSEGVTPPSSLLRTHAPVQTHSLLLRLLTSSMGLCRLSPVPAACWTFPVLSPLILPWVSGPVPRWVPVVLSPVSSHGNIGLLQALTGSTFPPHSRKTASHGVPFRGCSHSVMFKPPGLLATLAAPTTALFYWAAVTFTPEHLMIRYLIMPRIC